MSENNKPSYRFFIVTNDEKAGCCVFRSAKSSNTAMSSAHRHATRAEPSAADRISDWSLCGLLSGRTRRPTEAILREHNIVCLAGLDQQRWRGARARVSATAATSE